METTLVSGSTATAQPQQEAWKRPGTSPVKAGVMRNLMTYSDKRPLTSPVRSRRPRNISPVKKRGHKKDAAVAQPFYRGLFGVKGSKKRISTSSKKLNSKVIQVKVPNRGRN